MKRTLLQTVLRREVVGLARIAVILLTAFLVLLELSAPVGGDALLDRLAFGLLVGAVLVTAASILRQLLREGPVRRAELLWAGLVLLMLTAHPFLLGWWDDMGRWPVLTALVIFSFIELSRLEIGRNTVLFNPALLFTMSFVLLILIGSALLSLPRAGATERIPLLDALFTSTSAVCVTGLSVIDVGSDLSRTGQWTLLLLIQLGGLGVMTFTSFFAFFFKGRNSLEEQLRIRDIANTSLRDARSFIVNVILFSLSVELIGAGFILWSLPADLFPGGGERLFFAVFHSVSAFNNAGFSTLTAGMYEPVLRFQYAFMWVIAVLLIAGGLGFGIIFNFARYVRLWVTARIRRALTGIPCQRHPRLVTLSTRLVLLTSAALLVAGTLGFLVLEHGSALQEHEGWWAKLSVAFFTSATPRTAGFNVVDYAHLTTPSLMLTLLLMYIGASPGSTGGGIKTTTFAIATLNVFSTARGRKRIEYGGREISNLSVRRAFATIVLSLVFLGLAVAVVASFEKGVGLLPVAFECFSAFSTVGLSTGITAQLGGPARIALIVIMFVGRVSALTLLVGVLRQVTTTNYEYPREDILIN